MPQEAQHCVSLPTTWEIQNLIVSWDQVSDTWFVLPKSSPISSSIPKSACTSFWVQLLLEESAPTWRAKRGHEGQVKMILSRKARTACASVPRDLRAAKGKWKVVTRPQGAWKCLGRLRWQAWQPSGTRTICPQSWEPVWHCLCGAGMPMTHFMEPFCDSGPRSRAKTEWSGEEVLVLSGWPQ